MPSALVTATIQAAVLNATSNVLAQAISAYRKDAPLSLNLLPILHFVIFTLLNCPPNFLWQEYLEQRFPGNTASTAISEKSQGAAVKKKLNVGNTVKKLILDQTVGAAVNTVLFTAVIGALKGLSGEDIADVIKQDFGPVMRAGLKLWPLVSLLNFTVVPVEKRILVGSMVGVGWGVYLSLMAAG
ncbi:hypothetical protein MMC16_003646 [Acarospora aff. strigata]|nr:hypothetical protein [Acarospora aff. strigata]